MKLLRNLSNATIETNYRGRRVHIAPKGTLLIADPNLGEAMAAFLLETYGFLRLEEQIVKHPVIEVKKALPKRKRR